MRQRSRVDSDAGRSARPGAGRDSRRVAASALARIEHDGAYANLVLPEALRRSGLDERDRSFVTELVYGTTRMRRACDAAVQPFLRREPDATARTWLRLGAYQLLYTDVPDHAVLDATVGAAPHSLRGFLNAVLRRVASWDREWPDVATELSFPDWIVERLVADLGSDSAWAALRAMNEAPQVSRRADGYVQDLTSQRVASLVGAEPGEVVIDLAAAPGGKATAIAAAGAWVVAADVRRARAGLVEANSMATGVASRVAVVVADGRRPPFREGSADRVLVDAPCSGLGTLHRRADARWRMGEEDLGRLSQLQAELFDSAVRLVRPGGLVVYSVCTLTRVETVGIDQHAASRHPRMTPESHPGPPWEPVGRGARVLPGGGSDGMYVLRLRRPLDATSTGDRREYG